MSKQLNMLEKVKTALRDDPEVDGWLLYDFRGSNPIFYDLVEEKPWGCTRRLFLWLPKEGTPVLLVHAIEEGNIPPLPIHKRSYTSEVSLSRSLQSLLSGKKKIAMEYVPGGGLPSLSWVDGGTIDSIRNLGLEIVSSSDLLLKTTSVLSTHEINSHLEATQFLNDLLESFWKEVVKRNWTESEASDWLFEQIEQEGFETSWHPHVAINSHSSDPHFCPRPTQNEPIKEGDWLLVDLGCKKGASGIYGDLTRVAVLGRPPSKEEEKLFSILLKAQKKGVSFLNEKLSKGKTPLGFEVDKVVREVIEEAGYGPFFIHRTGHNITTSVHGPGTHLDSFETVDTRPLLPSTCYSLEPGIYLPNRFGIRLETNFIVENTQVNVSGGWQEEIYVLPAP